MLNNLVGEGVITAMVLVAKLGFAYIAIMWGALIYWTFRDIRRRTNDFILQSGSVLLTTFFFLPGYWLYLVLRPRLTLSELAEERFREALFAEYGPANACPKCKHRTSDEYLICPFCQEQLKTACSGCSRALLNSWKACPYCAQAAPTLLPEAKAPAPALPAPKAAPKPERKPVRA